MCQTERQQLQPEKKLVYRGGDILISKCDFFNSSHYNSYLNFEFFTNDVSDLIIDEWFGCVNFSELDESLSHNDYCFMMNCQMTTWFLGYMIFFEILSEILVELLVANLPTTLHKRQKKTLGWQLFGNSIMQS